MTGQSYAAIAVAAAALNPKTEPPTSLQKATIDYTGEETNVQPGASYAAIAVAWAAKEQN
jgi:hypothetical protein